jgi:predicted TIM-barrel enzyme
VPSAAFDAVPGLVGFVAGSSIERVEVHRAIEAATRTFKELSLGA